MSTVFFDSWENPVYVSRDYIQHRQRIISRKAIITFRVKNRRFLINHFNHNDKCPTMCIMFETKEDALAAFNELREMMFGEEKEKEKKEEELHVQCFSRSLKWLNGLF